MAFITNLENLAAFTRVRPARAGTQGLPAVTTIENSSRGDFLKARNLLLRLHRALETLAELADVKTRFKLDLPDARSSQSLGLDLTTTAASLVSTGEINASPRSFSPFGPDWAIGSNALITIGGEYDGTHSSGALRFEVRRPGIKGIDNLRIRVEDPQGALIRSINIRPSDDPDQEYSLNNGLFLKLGPGLLIDNDTTSIQVFDNVGSAVDPDKPLGGVRNDNPHFQYYPSPNTLPPIADGSFLLNGESISVSTSDTLNDVVARINQSNAGVTAVFNAVTERIEFLQNTTGSAPTIDIQSDTSNFILSTKLSGAVVTPGVDPESIKAFHDVAAFASIQSGSILINDTAIAIDTATDSLVSVIDRINASGAGVTASFDPSGQRVLIEARDAASRLDIDSNGTGFFAAVHIAEGRVDPEAVARGISLRRSYRIADALETVFAELNRIFQDRTFDNGSANASLFRAPLEAALSEVIGDSSRTSFGIRLDPSTDARRRGTFTTVIRRDFTEGLQLRGNEVKTLLSGSASNPGLVGGLIEAVHTALTGVSLALGQSGRFVDIFV